MRRSPALIAPCLLAAALAALGGCTLTRRAPEAPPVVVTATLSAPLPLPGTPAGDPAWPEQPSATPPVPTPTPSATVPPTGTPAPTATATRVAPSAPPPTRTIPGPTAAPPLDDGSGRLVPGTGSQGVAGPVPGVDALPETLYYLSDAGDFLQVWRLRVGLSHPDQLTFSPTGVAAFDVAPDGTLAYLTPGGDLIVGGIPLLPPASPDGTSPRATALAFDPEGNWLAYVLATPGADQAGGGAHPVDGLWMRNRQGATVFLQPSVYAADATRRIFSGPLGWRPDGTEILAGCAVQAGQSYLRANIITGVVTPGWNTTALPPAAYTTARWSVNGNAIIASGTGSILRIEPDTLGVQTLLGPDAGLWPDAAQQFANGTVTFVHDPPAGPRRLYLLAPGATTPSAVTGDLAPDGALDFLWDDTAQEVLLVAYAQPGDPLGAASLLTADRALHDLTPLTGPVGAPRWGPLFKPGDPARVRTTAGDPLNVRAAPGGDVVIALVSGSRVTVTGGPRRFDGYRWWRVQTPDRVAGWVVEAVTDERGLRLRTLLPAD